MTASIIDGKAAAQRLRERVGAEVARLQSEHQLQPALAVVLVQKGDPPTLPGDTYSHPVHAGTMELSVNSRGK